MKILMYGINFAPEPTGIGKYSGEMAAWLARSGNEVRVICAPPYYPTWSVSSGYSMWRSMREQWEGVSIWRTPLWVPRHPTGLRRIVHLLSFALFSIPALLRQLAWRPDVIVVVAPALTCAPAAWLAARACGAKAWLHLQDFEVDAAFRVGLLRGVRLRNLATAIEGWTLGRFDRVSTISGRMLDLLRAKRVDDARIVLFPNWVDVNAVTPHNRSGAYRAELDIAADAVIALYSGSMAGKQGLELLPAAARELLKRAPHVILLLCGQGVYLPTLIQECAGLPNVRMLPLQPAARLGELLAGADVHLLPQQASVADLVMPSKLTGMLSSGRAVVATANPRTELAQVVSKCGIVVPPGDLIAFVDAIVSLAQSPELRARLGRAGRRYAEENLARDRVLVGFEQALKRCINESSAPVIDASEVLAATNPARQGQDHVSAP
jgi:colanic acid biosynthesis glycosyl transferase WcaI